jgi:predicted amidophosphoribosyltransferase
MAKARAEAGDFLELLFPGRCLSCGRWLLLSGSAGLPVCGECRQSLCVLAGERCGICSAPLAGERGTCTRCRAAAFAFEKNLSVFAYSGHVRDLVIAFKIAGRKRLAGWFAEHLAELTRKAFPGRALVPAPARPGRRDPDGVERIARVLERRHAHEICRCLLRTGGVEQKTLDPAARRENLRGRIVVRPGFSRADLPPHPVVLDDVFTTGATADACARALLCGGCLSVAVLTLAID